MEDKILSSVTQITSSWISTHPHCSSGEIVEFIQNIYAALLSGPIIDKEDTEKFPRKLTKKQIADTVTDEYVICLEDGRKMKSLKRHLRAAFNMSPEEYRQRWGLPKDHPIVCNSYRERRSQIARQQKLGHIFDK